MGATDSFCFTTLPVSSPPSTPLASNGLQRLLYTVGSKIRNVAGSPDLRLQDHDVPGLQNSLTLSVIMFPARRISGSDIHDDTGDSEGTTSRSTCPTLPGEMELGRSA